MCPLHLTIIPIYSITKQTKDFNHANAKTKCTVHNCGTEIYENCGEKSILVGRHVVLLGFQSTPGLIEMKCTDGGIACGLCWMESFGRIILLGLFPLTDGLSCDKWRKTAQPQISSVCQTCVSRRNTFLLPDQRSLEISTLLIVILLEAAIITI